MSLSSNPSSFAGAQRSSKDSGLSTLLDANNLDSYVLPSALSVTVARSHKKSYATSDTYTTLNGNNTISFVLKPGSDYVYGPDSHISFDLTCSLLGATGTNSITFGRNGSVLNMIKSVRVGHASGTEIEFVDNANLLNMFKVQYERSRSWRHTKGSAMGMAPFRERQLDTDTEYKGVPNVNQITRPIESREEDLNNTTTRFAIPLSILSELFAGDKLLPPYALAGMRIELELEKPTIALQYFVDTEQVPAIAPSTPTVTISNIEVQLDSHTLTDSVQKALARMSAQEGLDLHFPSWFHDRHTMSGTTNTINITKALSRVEDIRLIPRVVDDYKDDPASMQKQSLSAERYATADAYVGGITSWQIAIGSMFFPSHCVTTAKQGYLLAQQGLSTDNDISFMEFRENGLACIRGNMERSQILNGSGIAISATRGATVNVTSNIGGRSFDLFVKHTRLLSVFLDNVVVRT